MSIWIESGSIFRRRRYPCSRCRADHNCRAEDRHRRTEGVVARLAIRVRERSPESPACGRTTIDVNLARTASVLSPVAVITAVEPESAIEDLNSSNKVSVGSASLCLRIERPPSGLLGGHLLVDPATRYRHVPRPARTCHLPRLRDRCNQQSTQRAIPSPVLRSGHKKQAYGRLPSRLSRSSANIPLTVRTGVGPHAITTTRSLARSPALTTALRANPEGQRSQLVTGELDMTGATTARSDRLGGLDARILARYIMDFLCF